MASERGCSPECSKRSFRDPSGFVVATEDRIYRCITPAGLSDFQAIQASPTVRRWVAEGRMIGWRPLAPEEIPAQLAVVGNVNVSNGALWVEHERLPFPSYPYEWPAEMLAIAGRHTLQLAQELLPEGLGLKDATPFNILFRGPDPVLVDLLSIERRDPLDYRWFAGTQFMRTFLLPLLVHRRRGLGLDSIFLTRREGFDPVEVYRMCTPLERLHPHVLRLVTIPVWLEPVAEARGEALYRPRRASSPEQARFILSRLLRRLERTLDALQPRWSVQASRWADYMASCPGYTREQFAQKAQFVQRVIEQHHPRQVLDVGANTGFFSLLAARHGAAVVAIDADRAAIGRLWHQAHQDRLPVLPLVVHFSQPSPATGWNNTECASFLDRARGRFDLVLLLAVVHHLLVTDRVTLNDLLAVVAALTTHLAVIEFVGGDDPMFRRLVRGRDTLYAHLTREFWERTLVGFFDIEHVETLAGGTRTLYLLKRKSS
jgi:SAM-dependent methyltransferase